MKEIHCEIGMIGRAGYSTSNIEFLEMDLTKGQYKEKSFETLFLFHLLYIIKESEINEIASSKCENVF